mgnify:CR=1 FL=1
MVLSKSERARLKSTYGPWAIVTGASSGIGRELAERLAESGLNVLLSARRHDLLEALASDLKKQYGIDTRVVAADLSEKKGIEQVIAAAEDLDVGLLVASAGYATPGLFIENQPQEILDVLQVNCTALVMLTHHFSRLFAGQKRGGIVLMSSIVAFQGAPYAAHYAATKAYVQSLAEALALELQPYGVDVLAAAPAPVHSGFAERADMVLGNALKPSDIGVPILKALGRKTTVLPGFLTKFLVGSLRTLPRWGKVRVMKLVMGAMTKHQRAAGKA